MRCIEYCQFFYWKENGNIFEIPVNKIAHTSIGFVMLKSINSLFFYKRFKNYKKNPIHSNLFWVKNVQPLLKLIVFLPEVDISLVLFLCVYASDNKFSIYHVKKFFVIDSLFLLEISRNWNLNFVLNMIE